LEQDCTTSKNSAVQLQTPSVLLGPFSLSEPEKGVGLRNKVHIETTQSFEDFEAGGNWLRSLLKGIK
jgi:hypothetical protein